MPANIIHQDLFEVELSHEIQPLQINSNPEATLDAKGDPSKPTEHVRNLSGLSNKLLVLPIVLPKSNRTMHMSFNLKPGFDFVSGNAVLIGLRVGSTTRGSELILKESHETKQPDSSSGFHWGRIQLAEAAQGTMVITVTRGVKVKKAKFVPLVGEGGKPYSVEIEWRVLKARPGGAGAPEVSPTATPTSEIKEIKPSASKRSAAEAFGPAQARRREEHQEASAPTTAPQGASQIGRGRGQV
jgi:hypothetical protein